MPNTKQKYRTQIADTHIAFFTIANGQKYMVKVWDDILTENSHNVYLGSDLEEASREYNKQVHFYSEKYKMNDSAYLKNKIEKVSAFKLGDRMFLGAPEEWIKAYQKTQPRVPFIDWMKRQSIGLFQLQK